MFKFFGGRGEAPKNKPEKISGSKSEPTKEPTKEPVILEKSEEKSPLAGLSLEEVLKIIKEKKKEISELRKKRIEYYNKLIIKKEEMKAAGLDEKTQKDLLERVRKGIISFEEGGDLVEEGSFSREIEEIKNKYGLEITSLEILSTRMFMMLTEAERLAKNLQFDKKESQEFINNQILPSLQEGNVKVVTNNFINISNSLLKESNFDLETEKGLSLLADQIYYAVDFKLVKSLITDYANRLNANIKENNPYKTEEEATKALKKHHRVNKIINLIDVEITKVTKGEGEYAKK